MKELYLKRPSPERFNEYMRKLQGDSKGDLVLPIGGFNPMAKAHVLEKIAELEALGAEAVMDETIKEFNAQRSISDKEVITTVLNLADDLRGRWTNFYSTDYDSKFKLNAFVQRLFCVPYFWTSESFSRDLIHVRTQQYLSRTYYLLNNPLPKSLADHLEQEIFVNTQSKASNKTIGQPDFATIKDYYLQHKDSEEYGKIFHFFYGDEGSESLGLRGLGLAGLNGFDYAAYLAIERGA